MTEYPRRHYFPQPIQDLYDQWNAAWDAVTETSLALGHALREHAQSIAPTDPELAHAAVLESMWRLMCSGDSDATDLIAQRATNDGQHLLAASAVEMLHWFVTLRSLVQGDGFGVVDDEVPPPTQTVTEAN